MPFVHSNDDALNRRFSFKGAEGPYVRIVGVAADGKYFNISEAPRPFVWTPMNQDYSANATLVVRTKGGPESMFANVRHEIQSLDPNLPLFDVQTLNDHMRLSLFPARIAATVLGVFGVVALVLAAIGIYGITSYAVAQRTREIGIRMALGAQLGDVLKLVLSQGVKLTLVGVAIGLSGAYLVTRAITSVLYGVSATDPLTFVGVSLLLLSVALLACYVPARKATKVNPLIALRYE
jgi:ABC-type antimicrobial peptide transport system permease subunit